jgi:hypothetical protein
MDTTAKFIEVMENMLNIAKSSEITSFRITQSSNTREVIEDTHVPTVVVESMDVAITYTIVGGKNDGQ